VFADLGELAVALSGVHRHGRDPGNEDQADGQCHEQLHEGEAAPIQSSASDWALHDVVTN
jgi:hypothetical protein